jgi:hypothetical protein
MSPAEFAAVSYLAPNALVLVGAVTGAVYGIVTAPSTAAFTPTRSSQESTKDRPLGAADPGPALR